MSNDYLLAIDCGTQSASALLFDLHGHLVAKAQIDIASYRSPQPGCVVGSTGRCNTCVKPICRSRRL